MFGNLWPAAGYIPDGTCSWGLVEAKSEWANTCSNHGAVQGQCENWRRAAESSAEGHDARDLQEVDADETPWAKDMHLGGIGENVLLLNERAVLVCRLLQERVSMGSLLSWTGQTFDAFFWLVLGLNAATTRLQDLHCKTTPSALCDQLRRTHEEFKMVCSAPSQALAIIYDDGRNQLGILNLALGLGFRDGDFEQLLGRAQSRRQGRALTSRKTDEEIEAFEKRRRLAVQKKKQQELAQQIDVNVTTMIEATASHVILPGQAGSHAPTKGPTSMFTRRITATIQHPLAAAPGSEATSVAVAAPVSANCRPGAVIM